MLAARFPELRESVPWRPLADAPTPIERATVLEEYADHPRIWVKRDDSISPLYGGNKVRRFEYLFADAAAKKAKTLFTAGGLASTQVIATTVHGRAAGFDVTAVLFDQPVTTFAREAVLLDQAAGAKLVRGGGYVTSLLRGIAAYRREDAPYLILPGASNPMAVLGYIDAMLEVGKQVEEGLAPRPDLIVLPTGSGGTLAGLAIGASILGWDTLVIGVRITELVACNRLTLGLLIRSTMRYLARHALSYDPSRLPTPRFSLHHGAIGRGYGEPTREAIAAIPVVERLVGVPGEVTYSGKALAGLRAIARENKGKTILFWQTLSSKKPEVDWSVPPPPGFEDMFTGDVEV